MRKLKAVPPPASPAPAAPAVAPAAPQKLEDPPVLDKEKLLQALQARRAAMRAAFGAASAPVPPGLSKLDALQLKVMRMEELVQAKYLEGVTMAMLQMGRQQGLLTFEEYVTQHGMLVNLAP